MIEGYLRPFIQPILFDPAARLIGKKISSPIALTLFSLLAGILVLPMVLLDFRMAAVSFLWASGLLDILDGTLARVYGKSSPFGAVIDIVSDRLVEFTVILSLFLAAPDERALLSLLMLGSILLCVTSFLVVGLFSDNEGEKSFHYSPGLMERAESFLLFSLMILLPSRFFLFGGLFTILVLITTGIRLFEFGKKNPVHN